MRRHLRSRTYRLARHRQNRMLPVQRECEILRVPCCDLIGLCLLLNLDFSDQCGGGLCQRQAYRTHRHQTRFGVQVGVDST